MRQGLLKQDRMKHFSTKVFVQAFSENKKLDPKRTLAFYLKRTEKFRKVLNGKDEAKLFL